MTHHLVGMAEIAEILGVTRQRVGQLIESYEDFPKPEVELTGGRIWSRTAVESWIASHPERGPGRPEEKGRRPRFFGRQSGELFSRFTDRARRSVVLAQEEARLGQHNYIGTEHLLLGLVSVGEGVAFVAVSALGVSLEQLRATIIEMIGPGPDQPKGHIPFTPRAKKVLEMAMSESLRLGHNYIGTEHVLLALMREGQGVAPQALTKLGHEPKQVMKKTMEVLQGYGVAASDPAITASCSFCGKTRDSVKSLVAGPGDIAICNECVALSAEILTEEGNFEAVEADIRIANLERRISKLEGKEAT